MPLFIVVNHKAYAIGTCNITTPYDVRDAIMDVFPWRRTDDLTLYNTANYDNATLQVTINNYINKGYALLNPLPF